MGEKKAYGTRMKRSAKTKAITGIQAALAVLVVIGAVWLVTKMVGYNQAQQIYRDMQAAYAAELDSSADVEEYVSPIDFAALQADYPDVVGWLVMDDLDINYPIVQGTDNDYYLYHDPSGADSISGSIFLDYRNKSLDDDSYAILYGHNMADNSMFGLLGSYVDAGFYEQGTDMFTVYTPKGAYRYQIFAANIVDPMDAVYQMGFKNASVFGAFLDGLKASSMYETGVDVTSKDKILVLSTCSVVDRLVLCAKRIDG